ncbi:MAG: diguanylate cyclase, partial [Sedimentisphaerales bacterium]|nr:diguanylate cyclase [Sedimentisphaerales bacterium]
MTGLETSSGNARSEAVDLMLVADDGRIAALIGRLGGLVRLRQVPHALDAICRLAADPCSVVLINLAGLEQDAAPAVHACRRVRPSCRILLYGEAHQEGYARQALAAGADDYLIWPIPARELYESLRPAGDRSGLAADPAADPKTNPATGRISAARQDSMADPAETTGQADPAAGAVNHIHSYLHCFRGLAELIPRGREILIERAQSELADLLAVEWLEIRTDEQPAENRPAEPPANGSILPLCGPAGKLGMMRLGPSRSGSAASNGAVETAGEFLATLLHLAQRDESLKHLATVDELTGAYNRRYLEYFLRQVIETTDNRDTEVTLLIFDLDEFKYYNDTYGHLAGDEVLRQTTRLMRRCCRSHDIVARLGGDEFAVLFWDT